MLCARNPGVGGQFIRNTRVFVKQQEYIPRSATPQKPKVAERQPKAAWSEPPKGAPITAAKDAIAPLIPIDIPLREDKREQLQPLRRWNKGYTRLPRLCVLP
jgi:hypothetical protein